MSAPKALALDSVAHLLMPWESPALDLEDLLARVESAPPEVLFTHVVHGWLRHASADAPPVDDLSTWVASALQDPETAERLSFALQPPFEGPEAVRERARQVLRSLGEKRRRSRHAPDGGGLRMLAASSVRFPIGHELTDAHSLESALASAGFATWFLYLLEEPWYRGGASELHEWAAGLGDARLARELAEATNGSEPLARACAKLHRRLRLRHLPRRLAEASLEPEHVRRATAREAALRLARRATEPGEAS